MNRRLQTVISRTGLTSRRQAAKLIEEGKVTVDGKVITEKGYRVDDEGPEILVEGKPLPERDKEMYYYLFNKPKDVISTAHDPEGRKKVLDYFEGVKGRLYPIGRLDKDTTGALIVTNNGDLTERLSHPKYGVPKVYLIKVLGHVTDESLAKIKRGVDLDGKKTAPCELEVVEADRKTSIITLNLHEGKKRQIKRIFGTQGHRILALKRIGYAGISLGDLKEGEYRELTPEEVKLLTSYEPASPEEIPEDSEL